ncbi:hypothetical protein J1605_020614 [Eschrichtius robustus]|uniref:Uncharacterized protein n=1 Tax=Eschrichtius robustus TaxID=9764 RepID=A0AB34HJZ2_ESCRO|nr:hypothetical protein J1605_020614 [Eschrichtius robustus]
MRHVLMWCRHLFLEPLKELLSPRPGPPTAPSPRDGGTTLHSSLVIGQLSDEEVVPGFLQWPPVKVFVEHRYDFVDRSVWVGFHPQQ